MGSVIRDFANWNNFIVKNILKRTLSNCKSRFIKRIASSLHIRNNFFFLKETVWRRTVCSHRRWIDVPQRPYLTHKSFNNFSSSVYAYFPHDTICPKCVSDKCNTTSPHSTFLSDKKLTVGLFLLLWKLFTLQRLQKYILNICCLKDFGI